MNQNYANSNVGDNNEAPAVPVIAPTCRDVLNGRGQGVQRHPGNEKYRKLVFVNKVRQAGHIIRKVLHLLFPFVLFAFGACCLGQVSSLCVRVSVSEGGMSI